ncbi:hypothetical protein M5G22_25635 [Pseudomonas sp. TNT2022 ID233]|uniref:hypothetical protein n=1 Tax=Pseudomonas aphyarum TaxID=2942629 RepID=UPI00235E0D46|nr:hypothetical protein [Pseudomonas aphyarum]MDD1140956.1 hypothetical protein [Pseudomonas aphyarum]
MRPKPPSLPSLSKGSTPADSLTQPPRLRPHAQDSLLPHTLPDLTALHDRNPGYTPPAAGTPERPKIEVSDLPVAAPEAATGLNSYLLNRGLLRNMQPANEEGLRYVVGRTFVDVKDSGTVYVEFDAALGTYRAMDLYKKLSPGPALYRNTGDSTWSPALHTPLKRPLSQASDIETQVPAKQPRTSALSAHEATTRLLNDSLLKLYPLMTLGQRVELLRAYNLSPRQHIQLRNDLEANPRVMPEWAEQQHIRSRDVNDATRFDQLQEEIEPLLLPVRNGTLRSDLVDFDKSVTREFLDAFLTRLGYLRNSSDCLYRTDIPGLFRADERTPFEFYNDGRMLPRLKHPRGATTEKPISATVSHKLVKMYGAKGTDAPDPEYLRYNSQRNKYPGKKPGESDNESGNSDNEWSDASDIELDTERNYETIRHDQQFIFSYVIDTRRMEVVLNEENHLLNLAALEKNAWFPEDELEALISTSKRGIESERLWLLDSTFTRAAKVDDVAALAQSSYIGNDIEARTHSGVANQREYDDLIDKVAKAGKPILSLPSGKDWFANDIVWPE